MYLKIKSNISFTKKKENMRDTTELLTNYNVDVENLTGL